MAMPPMVGVPAFTVWPSGTSSWMGWPIPRAISRSMRALVPKMAMPPARHAAMRRATTGRILAGLGGPRAPPTRSSKSSVRSPTICTASWPFPAITTTSPALGLVDGQGDGGRAGRARRPPAAPAGMPARIASMIAERVLAPRVVGGEDHPIGEAGGHLAHLRPLARVAIAARADDHDHPAPGGGVAGGRQRALEGAGLVGVVDEHRERLALVDRLEPARDRRAPAPSPAAIVVVGDAERARRRWRRPARCSR